MLIRQKAMDAEEELSPHPDDLPHTTILTPTVSCIEGFHDDPCVICQVNKFFSFILPQGWPLIISTNVYTGLILSSHR